MNSDQFSSSMGYYGFKVITDANSPTPAGEVYCALKAKGGDADVTATLLPGNSNADTSYSEKITENDVELGRFTAVSVGAGQKVLAFFPNDR